MKKLTAIATLTAGIVSGIADRIKMFIKKLTPNFILFIYRKYNGADAKEKRRIKRLEKRIINYLENVSSDKMTDEVREVLDYWKQRHSLSIFPYSYEQKYDPENVAVYRDNERDLCYVLHDGKRLYFKKEWNERCIKKYYYKLLAEQDAESPHRYETSGFHVKDGDVVVDAGVAEGNFALSVIEKVKKIYLFEVDEEWIEVLKVTFEPWMDKVVIINKYVSDNDENNCVTLDSLLGNERIDFIKADIEGAEIQLCLGAKAIFVLCTYHRHDDAKTLEKILTEKGFNTEFSRGYMIFMYEMYDKLKPPYLRRGLIRAVKNTDKYEAKEG
ncbi:MAG: FkbM family methyltransferase [Dysgonamonadaceae bacterium]|jgi:hypothetical protein|nr:FkbM family methyltransferase [Dysgonamonadaceae bacterium]